MKLAVFDTHAYDHQALAAANGRYAHELTFLEPRLTRHTASLAAGLPAVCSFVNDRLDAEALATLHAGGTQSIALRSAGYNHVDPTTHHLIDAAALAQMRRDVMLINLSDQVLQDDVLALLTFSNVLITSHQAFLTREALANIAHTTLANVSAFERGEHLSNEVRAEQVWKTVPER